MDLWFHSVWRCFIQAFLHQLLLAFKPWKILKGTSQLRRMSSFLVFIVLWIRHYGKYSTALSSTHRNSPIPRGTAHSARRFSEDPSWCWLVLLRYPATQVFSRSFITTAGKTGKSPAKKRPTRTWLSSCSTENQLHWEYSKAHRYTADQTSTANSALPLQSHMEASDSSLQKRNKICHGLSGCSPYFTIYDAHLLLQHSKNVAQGSTDAKPSAMASGSMTCPKRNDNRNNKLGQ